MTDVVYVGSDTVQIVEVASRPTQVIEILGGRGPMGPPADVSDLVEALASALDRIAALEAPAGGDAFVGAVDGDALQVTLTSRWGIDADGVPYWDPDGATPGEEAWPSLDEDGTFMLTKLEGEP